MLGVRKLHFLFRECSTCRESIRKYSLLSASSRALGLPVSGCRFLGVCVKGPAGCVFADASSSPCVWPVFKDGMEVIRPGWMGLGSRGGNATSESNFKFRFPQIILLVFTPLKSAPDEITSKRLEF